MHADCSVVFFVLADCCSASFSRCCHSGANALLWAGRVSCIGCPKSFWEQSIFPRRSVAVLEESSGQVVHIE